MGPLALRAKRTAFFIGQTHLPAIRSPALSRAVVSRSRTHRTATGETERQPTTFFTRRIVPLPRYGSVDNTLVNAQQREKIAFPVVSIEARVRCRRRLGQRTESKLSCVSGKQPRKRKEKKKSRTLRLSHAYNHVEKREPRLRPPPSSRG